MKTRAFIDMTISFAVFLWLFGRLCFSSLGNACIVRSTTALFLLDMLLLGDPQRTMRKLAAGVLCMYTCMCACMYVVCLYGFTERGII